jgi:exodeoxyribonuclease V beta subunit
MNAPSAYFPPLRWQQLSLDGRTLIQASAGTGKTFTIGLIFLRLLLERELRVEQILVTTFTDAAAQELRERLRRRLVEAEQLLMSYAAPGTAPSELPEEDSLGAYLWRFCIVEGVRKSALRRIQLARADFDRAPIATFHALCQRIQRDYPMESGAGFAASRLLDERDLLGECLEDFWRRRYLASSIAQEQNETVLAQGPEGMLRDVAGLLADQAQLIAADGAADLAQCMGDLASAGNIAELRRLASDATLYRKGVSALKIRFGKLAAILNGGQEVNEQLKEILDGQFRDETVRGQQPPDTLQPLVDHPLVRQLQRIRKLLGLQDDFARGAVLADALTTCRAELPRRARLRDAQTFSMLIDTRHARLGGTAGPAAAAALADALFKAFPAALIDEFQDTDQRQFEIFDRIFRDSAGAPRGSLAMIGDPKQAIFGFRGGDLATYLRASEQATQRYSLTVNRRSDNALVQALNALYGHTDGGFGDARIRYQPVSAQGKTAAQAYTRGGMTVATPLSIHRFRASAANGEEEPEDALGKLQALALEDCANRIAELLNDPTQAIAGRRVGPGDVAVLLATNMQIAALRKLLTARGVPCVGNGRGSVFDGETARDLELILYAVHNADDDRAVRGALSTRLLGATLADFAAWLNDPQALERELERFVDWRNLARMRGVLALVDALLEHRGAHWLAATDGERTITDIRHLGELLAEQESVQNGLGGLYAWFAALRREGGDGDADAADARQLRIESDFRRVQLLTVHASKGLEFPIVFLPLAWRIASREKRHAPKVLRFHDEAGQPCIDLGSANFLANRGHHFREDLQERQRLLYVALTRAVHAVHVYWVDRGTRANDDSELWRVPAIDTLILQAQTSLGLTPGEAALEDMAKALGGVSIVEGFIGAGAGFIASTHAGGQLAARTPLPGLRDFQWLHSFSSLTRQAQVSDLESAAADEAEPDPGSADEIATDIDQAEDAQLLALQPWSGARFGEAVHQILERARPGPVWPQQRTLLETQLSEQAVRADSPTKIDPLEPVGRMIDRVRAADLGDGLRLSSLGSEARVAEFEFQFPVNRVSVATLRALCAAQGYPDVVPSSLRSVTLNGMLTGFADLIFVHEGRYHVLDYKSNRLGARLSDYQPQALDGAMRAHQYPLQALLYTLALHRYLGQRLDGYTPERHLGDSWYLFLRAIGLRPGLGVWRRRWPPALIVALDDAFAGPSEAAA